MLIVGDVKADMNNNVFGFDVHINLYNYARVVRVHKMSSSQFL